MVTHRSDCAFLPRLSQFGKLRSVHEDPCRKSTAIVGVEHHKFPQDVYGQQTGPIRTPERIPDNPSTTCVQVPDEDSQKDELIFGYIIFASKIIVSGG